MFYESKAIVRYKAIHLVNNPVSSMSNTSIYSPVKEKKKKKDWRIRLRMIKWDYNKKINFKRFSFICLQYKFSVFTTLLLLPYLSYRRLGIL